MMVELLRDLGAGAVVGMFGPWAVVVTVPLLAAWAAAGATGANDEGPEEWDNGLAE